MRANYRKDDEHIIKGGVLMKRYVVAIIALFCGFISVNMLVAAPGIWIQKADFGGGARDNAVCFSIGSKGYMGTGLINSSDWFKDFWEYDPAANTWTQKADFGGIARTAAIGFSIGSKGYIGLGYPGSADFWEYDPTANTWTRKADFGGGQRYNAVGFSTGNKGYVGTGSDGSALKKDFWEYDPAANTWTQKADFGGIARNSAVGFSIGDKGYLGIGGDASSIYKDFWEYNPATNTWTQKADFGGGVRLHAVGFSIGSKGYVGTGDAGLSYQDLWEYDSAGNAWTQKADLGGGTRGNAVGFSIGNKGYIGTGASFSSGQLADFWEYEPAGTICGVGDTAGLVGYWKFDEIDGVTAADSFSGYTGILTYENPAVTAPTFATGKVANALSLSDGQYVTIPSNDALNITGDLTIAMWVLPNSIACDGADAAYDLVSKRSGNWPTPYEFMIGCGGSLRYEAWPGHYPSPNAATVPGVVTAGVWQHVAMTRSYSGTFATVTFYVNGVSVGSSTQDIGPTVASSDPVWISRDGYHTWHTNQGSFSGLMDEIAIFNRALSSSEMTNLYSSTNAGNGYCLCDTTPEAFTFTDQTDVALNTLVTSNTITVAGIDTVAPISIVGGTYAINGGSYTSASGNVINGDTLTVQQTSSGSNSTTTDATLTIGGVSDTFSVTTVAAGPAETVTVTSPNGGESWVVGSSHNITWSSTGAIANVNIDYSTDNGSHWTSAAAGTTNAGIYAWTVPYAASTQCLVRVSDASNAEIYDVSNAVFNIFSDGTEPNSDPATAAVLPMGTTENLVYDGGANQDIDWYKFFVPAEAEGQDLKVNVRVTSPYPDPIPYPEWASDLDFDLLDSSLRVLGATVCRSDNETLYLHNVASGWYYIFVGFSTTEYADSSTYARYRITLEAGTGFGLGYITGRVVNGSAQGVQDVFLLLDPAQRRLEHLPALHDDRGRRELRHRVPAGNLYASVHQCGASRHPQ